jgi:hypothetical protein
MNRTGWDTLAAAPTGPSGGASAAVLTAVPTWIKVGNAISYTVFSTAATTQSIVLFSLIPGAIISGTKIKHSAAFGGGTISGYTLSLGIAGNLLKYSSAFDVFQAPGASIFSLADILGSESQSAATNILVTAVSTGDTLNDATTGTVNIWACLSTAL